MKKVTKAIKTCSSLSEEEKQDFYDFFKQEEEEVEEKEVVVKEEPKKEEKVEVVDEQPKKEEAPKKEEKDFDKVFEMMQSLAKEVKTLKETNEKLKSFGAQPKKINEKELDDFDTFFGNVKARK